MTARMYALISSAWICACGGVPEGPDPAAALGPSLPGDSPPEARLLAIAWGTVATPIHSGARIGERSPNDALTVFARVSDDSAVEAVEFWVGTRKSEIAFPPSPLVAFDWKPAVAMPEQVTLRLVARDHVGQEAVDLADVLVTPAAYDTWLPSRRTDWRLVLDTPDTWSSACGQVRVRARLAKEEPGNPFEFLTAVTWTVLLDDVYVATSDGEEFDEVVDLRSAEGGPRSLLVWAGLRAVNAVNGNETSWSVAREVVLDVTGSKSCPPPPCSVRVRGIDDGQVIEAGPGVVSAEVEPDSPGTEVEFLLDDAPFWTDAAVPHVAPLPGDLEDGRHVLRALVRLPGGGSCEDHVRFTKDSMPPALSYVEGPSPGCAEWASVRVRDTTQVRFSRFLGTEDPPVVDEGGALTYSVPLASGRPWTIGASDLLGHAAEIAGTTAPDDEPPRDLRLHAPTQAWGTWLVALQWQDCALPETLDVLALVDGKPASEAGLSFGGLEDVVHRGRSSGYPSFVPYELLYLPGRWDTTLLPDGVHDVRVQVLVDGNPVEVQSEVITLGATMTGEELWLSVCDPEFSSCGPVGTTRVPGPVGLAAEVPWYAPDLPAPRITIRANDAEVATCEDLRCEWVLDFEALESTEVRVTATAEFEEAGVRLQASETFSLVEDDHDGDGYSSPDDGGEDCDDEDPFVHPGALDPDGPECRESGPPEVTVLAQGERVGLAMSAFRTADGSLHLVHCVSSLHAFEWVTLGAGGSASRLIDGGVPSCEVASSRVAFGPDGTPWVLLDEPGADPRHLVARLDRDPPEVQGLPIRLNRFGDMALVVPADGEPAVFVADGAELSLWRRVQGTWVMQPLASCPGWPTWSDSVVSVVAAPVAGMAMAAAQVCKCPLEVWALAPGGDVNPTTVSWDLHDHAASEHHYDRLPFVPSSFLFQPSPWVSEWSLAGVTTGRVGEPVVLLERKGLYEERNIPYVLRITETSARAYFLPADFPGAFGRPGWSLDRTLSVSLGRTASGSVLVAWTREPYANTTLSWEVRSALAGLPPAVVVARLESRGLAAPAVPADVAFEDAEVVAGGVEAGEVAARVAGGGEVRLLSWPCGEWTEDDTDCDGSP